MSLYLFCLYMPIDNNITENLNEYDNILTKISMICTQNNAEYICIAGDINTDLSRIISWYTSSLYNLLKMKIYIFLYIMLMPMLIPLIIVLLSMLLA